MAKEKIPFQIPFPPRSSAERQMDLLEQKGDPDSVSQESEAAARSTPKERIITNKEKRQQYAKTRALIRDTIKKLGKKSDEEEHPKLKI